MNPKIPVPGAAKGPQGTSRQSPSERRMRIKVVGVGGAGVNAIDRLALDGVDEVGLLAINTDAQALACSVAPEKLQIGENLTRGLGAGGDPKVGRAAAMEDVEHLHEALAGSDLVFIAAGMGGGTGTGAGPVIARIARETGALVLGFATMPFSHEGNQRIEIARQGLDEMREAVDAIIDIPNDKLLAMSGEETSVLDAFRPTDEFLSNGVRKIWQMLSRNGLINIDFADLCAVLRRRDGEVLFGFGEGFGTRKIEQALETALSSPLLRDAGLLSKATQMLVAVTHGPELPMRQLQRILEDIRQRMGSKVACKQGIIVDENYRDRVSLLIVASTGVSSADAPSEQPDAKRASRVFLPRRKKEESERSAHQDALPVFKEAVSEQRVEEPRKEGVNTKRKSPVSERSAHFHKQETLRLDETNRGLFDRVERTVVNGEDLDRPTFMRRGVTVRSL